MKPQKVGWLANVINLKFELCGKILQHLEVLVGCHYFPPGLQLPPQPLRGLLPVLLLW